MPDSQINVASSNGPHVLHVVDSGVFSRFGRMIRQLLLGLATAGARASLLTDDERMAVGCGPFAAECIHVPALTGWRAWRVARWVSSELEQPADLLHVWGTSALSVLERWSQRSQIPTLVHALSDADVAALTRRGPGAIRHVAGASQHLCQMLSAGKPASHFPVRRFAPALILPDCLTTDRRPQRAIGAVWAGLSEFVAGLDTVLKAISVLRDRNRFAQVMLIDMSRAESRGAGHRLWSAINESRLADRVSMIKGPAIWEEAIGGADVCLVPGCERELTLAPLLAMAMGKVVIASGDQLADWYVENKTAWLFKPGSPADLARLIERVQAEPDAAAALGESARSFVRERHTITGVAAELMEFYRTVGFPYKTLSLQPTDKSAARVDR